MPQRFSYWGSVTPRGDSRRLHNDKIHDFFCILPLITCTKVISGTLVQNLILSNNNKHNKNKDDVSSGVSELGSVLTVLL